MPVPQGHLDRGLWVALAAILGPKAAGLSATNIVRLKEGWNQDYERRRQRDLSGKHYVSQWVDGVHFNVALTNFVWMVAGSACGQPDECW